MSFIDIASPFIQFGIKVFPLSPRTKEPLKGFHFKTEASNQPSVIKSWNDSAPDTNVALLADDDFCFLEFDIQHGLKLAMQEMGICETPQTRYQMSGRNFLHCIFKHNARSREIGNRSVNLPEVCKCREQENKFCVQPYCTEDTLNHHHHHEWFSFRANNKYLVGAGSIHPNGELYKTKRDVEPIVVPDWILDFVEKHSVKPFKHKKADRQSVAEDFDFDEFCEHYGIGIRGVRDDVWHIVEECPGVGHRHKNSTLTGFYFDGDTLGWSCFAQGCPLFGKSIGQVISYLNTENDPYTGVIWEQDDSELSGVEDLDVLPDDLFATALEPEALFAALSDASPEQATTNPGTVVGDDGIVRLKPVSERTGVSSDSQQEAEEQPEATDNSEDGDKSTSDRDPAWKMAAFLGKDEVNLMLITKSAADYEMEELRWLWPQKIPLGKVVLFTGKPDCGKTMCALDLAARISTGSDFPDGSKNEMGPAKVLFASSEDDPKDTLIPRLTASGANLHNIDLIVGSSVQPKKGGKPGRKNRHELNLQRDIKLIEEAIKQDPEIKLLILDPLSSYFGKASQNEDKDIRPIMDALKMMCEKSGLTVVGLIHSNKRSDVEAVHKVSGAGSLAAASRAVWQFNRDAEDKKKFHMTNVKGNVLKDKRGITYSIQEADVQIQGKAVGVPRVVWGEITEEDADDQLQAGKDKKTSSDVGLCVAKAMLRSTIQYPAKAKDIYAKGEAEGISKQKMMRAKNELAKDGFLIVIRKEYDGWYWYKMGEDGSYRPTDTTKMIDVEMAI